MVKATTKVTVKKAPVKKAAPKTENATPAPTLGPEVGHSAPAFALPCDDGRTLSLKDFTGKQVVLYFYPKDDTSGCTQEAIEFNGLRKEFEAAETVIFGISPDSTKSHTKFKEKHELALALLADEDKHMLEAYGVWVEKSMYGKKYMGVERSTYLIDKAGKIAKVWRKVKVPGHAAEVLAAVRGMVG